MIFIVIISVAVIMNSEDGGSSSLLGCSSLSGITNIVFFSELDYLCVHDL